MEYMSSLPVWAPYEEFWNCITHAVMIPVSVYLTYKLVKQSIKNSKLGSNPYKNKGEKEKEEEKANGKEEEKENIKREQTKEETAKKESDHKDSNPQESQETIKKDIKNMSDKDIEKKQQRDYLYGHLDKQRLVGCIIYGICMTFLFVNSTVYHGSTNPKVKYILRYLDHCTIYFQIAGTYTPILLTVMRKAIGYGLIIYAWTFVVIGVITKILFFDRTFGTFIYLAMGWSICFFYPAVKKAMTKQEILWLFLGGLSYTIGCGFFALQKYHSFMHTIFHLFVSGGALGHFRCIYLLAD